MQTLLPGSVLLSPLQHSPLLGDFTSSKHLTVPTHPPHPLQARPGLLSECWCMAPSWARAVVLERLRDYVYGYLLSLEGFGILNTARVLIGVIVRLGGLGLSLLTGRSLPCREDNGKQCTFQSPPPHPHSWLGEIPAPSPSSLQTGSLAGRRVWVSYCVSLAAQVFPQRTTNGSGSCP